MLKQIKNNIKYMLTNANEYNSVGAGIGGGFGYGGFGGGGIAPFGLLGLLGIDSLGNRRKDNDCDNGVEHPLAILTAISNAKDATVAEGRALSEAICESEKTTLNQFYASAIQAQNLQQAVKDQATAFAIVNDKRFDDLSVQGANQTAAILARINDVENQNLRDQLFESRRGRDRSDLEISIQNTNTNVNAQFQAQAQLQLQAQLDEHRRRWDSRENEISIVNTNTNINAQAQAQAQAQAIRELDRDHKWNARFDALQAASAKANNEIVNIGGLVAASQANTANPTNVNTKQ